MTIEFFIPGGPSTKTHQQKKVSIKNGKPVFYEPQELKAVRAKLLASVCEYAPSKKISGPVRLVTKWCYPKGNHVNGEWKTTKPDTDNMIKLLKDCMTTARFWKDDAQVASEITEKFWANVPGIYVKVVCL